MGEDKVEAKGGGLTVAKVKTAKPGKYHDGAGTGLFLRVDPNGGRFWIQRVTIHGKRREIGLGGFPIVGLADARKAALANKQLAYTGGDPLAERRKARETLSFADAVDRYLCSKAGRVSERQTSQAVALDARHIRPPSAGGYAGALSRRHRCAASRSTDLVRQDGNRLAAARAH